MIGGGGWKRSRTDYGIAVTDTEWQSLFFDSGEGKADFGDDGVDFVNNIVDRLIIKVWTAISLLYQIKSNSNVGCYT